MILNPEDIIFVLQLHLDGMIDQEQSDQNIEGQSQQWKDVLRKLSDKAIDGYRSNHLRGLAAKESNKIENLNLGFVKLEKQDIEALFSADLSKLQSLQLIYGSIGNDGCSLLLRNSHNFRNIVNIDLTYNLIGDRGMKCISKIEWKSLKKIMIGSNWFTDVAIRYLTQSKWESLEEIRLADSSQSGFSDEGIKELKTANWQQLKALHLQSKSYVSFRSYLNLLAAGFQLLQIISFNDVLRRHEGSLQKLGFRRWKTINIHFAL